MKVIEKSKWSSQVKCTGEGNSASGCGSILEIEKSDIRYYAGKSGDPSIDGTFFYAPEAAVIRCPVCGCLTDLTKEQRPEDYKHCGPFTRAWRDGKEVDALLTLQLRSGRIPQSSMTEDLHMSNFKIRVRLVHRVTSDIILDIEADTLADAITAASDADLPFVEDLEWSREWELRGEEVSEAE